MYAAMLFESFPGHCTTNSLLEPVLNNFGRQRFSEQEEHMQVVLNLSVILYKAI
jgi:hypothetical protein